MKSFKVATSVGVLVGLLFTAPIQAGEAGSVLFGSFESTKFGTSHSIKYLAIGGKAAEFLQKNLKKTPVPPDVCPIEKARNEIVAASASLVCQDVLSSLFNSGGTQENPPIPNPFLQAARNQPEAFKVFLDRDPQRWNEPFFTQELPGYRTTNPIPEVICATLLSNGGPLNPAYVGQTSALFKDIKAKVKEKDSWSLTMVEPRITLAGADSKVTIQGDSAKNLYDLMDAKESQVDQVSNEFRSTWVKKNDHFRCIRAIKHNGLEAFNCLFSVSSDGWIRR